MEQLQQFLREWSVPLVPRGIANFWLGMFATLTIAFAIGALAWARLGFANRWRAILWTTCLVIPLAYTLTSAKGAGLPNCDLSWTPLLTPGALLNMDTRSNVLLTIPAGAAAMLLPTGAQRLAALGTALAMPVAIELTQLAVRSLGRGCQLDDVVNNQTGVVVGFWLAAGVAVLLQSLRMPASQPPKPGGSAG